MARSSSLSVTLFSIPQTFSTRVWWPASSSLIFCPETPSWFSASFSLGRSWGEAQDAITFRATASFDEFAVHFKDKGGMGRNVLRRAILAVGHSSRNGQRLLVTHLHPKHIHVPPLITWPDPTLNLKGFPDVWASNCLLLALSLPS